MFGALHLMSCVSSLQLEEQKAENEARCEAHRQQIQRLWGRLDVPREEREAFGEHMVASRRRNLEAVRTSWLPPTVRTPAAPFPKVHPFIFFPPFFSYGQKFSAWRS